MKFSFSLLCIIAIASNQSANIPTNDGSPTAEPTFSPTRTPTRNPIQNVDDIYDVKIGIIYVLGNLSETDMHSLQTDTSFIASKATEIIERNYFQILYTLEIGYKDFSIVFYDAFLSLDHEMWLNCDLLTSGDNAQMFMTASKTELFRGNTQNELAELEYFVDSERFYFDVQNKETLVSVPRDEKEQKSGSFVVLYASAFIIVLCLIVSLPLGIWKLIRDHNECEIGCIKYSKNKTMKDNQQIQLESHDSQEIINSISPLA